jgi:hypothetical protein
VPADDPETAVPRIIELVKTRIPKRFGLDPVRDIQVLCPMMQIPVHRGQSFRRIADSIPVIADSFW